MTPVAPVASYALNIPPAELAGDLLEGAEEISEFLFGDDPDPGARRQRLRRTYRLTSEVKPADQLPVFRIGQLLFARRSTLLRWIAEREARSA
jgi:hypothetical protein